MHQPREPLRAFARCQTFYLLFDCWRHDLFLSQGQATQNHCRHRHNRARQQRPHEKAASREKSEHDIHDSRRFGNDPGCDHPFGKIMKPRPSMSRPSEGKVFATSSGMGGRCASSTDCTQTFANASLELFSIILRSFTRPLRSTTNRSRRVPILIKSPLCFTYVYQRDPIESATIF